MGELFDGKPLFPGKDHIDQQHLIIKVLGPLTPDLKDLMRKNPDYEGVNFGDSKKYMTLEGRYKDRIHGKALSFQKGALAMSPIERFNVEECLCHPWFEDLRMKDPELAEQSKAFAADQNRIESTKCTDGGMETRMTSCNTTTHQQINKIRIKTLHENPLAKQKLSQNNDLQMDETKISPIRMSDNDIVFKKTQKAYHNMYVPGNQMDENKPQFKPVHDQQLRKNNYSQYTQQQFHTNNQNSQTKKNREYDNEMRSTQNQIMKQKNQFNIHNNTNNNRIRQDNTMGFHNQNKKNNTSNSQSQIHKKYNLSTQTKFLSRDRNDKIAPMNNNTGNSLTFAGGVTNGFNNYENLYSTGSFIKQLPTIHKKTLYNESPTLPVNPKKQTFYNDPNSRSNSNNPERIDYLQKNGHKNKGRNLNNMNEFIVKRSQQNNANKTYMNIVQNINSMNLKNQNQSNKYGYSHFKNNLF